MRSEFVKEKLKRSPFLIPSNLQFSWKKQTEMMNVFVIENIKCENQNEFVLNTHHEVV